jgi:hypothetical protein
MAHLNDYLASAAAVVAGLIALGHALESVVQLTPTKQDDLILGRVMGVLDAVSGFLPKIRF